MAVAKRFFLCLGMVAVSTTFPSNAAGDSEIGSPVREGRISSLFGMRDDPFEGELRFHAGIDIAAPVGTPVRPVAAGRVIFSGSYVSALNSASLKNGGFSIEMQGAIWI